MRRRQDNFDFNFVFVPLLHTLALKFQTSLSDIVILVWFGLANMSLLFSRLAHIA